MAALDNGSIRQRRWREEEPILWYGVGRNLGMR